MNKSTNNRGAGRPQGGIRVLHVVGGLGNSSGTTHIILNLSHELTELGCEVSVFYISGRARDTVLSDDPRVKVEGFPLTWNRTWGYSSGFGRALRSRAAEFDVIHVHSLWLYVNFAVWLQARGAHVPFVVSPQGALDDWTLAYHPFRKRIYAMLLERRILADAAAVHALSSVEAESIRRFGVASEVPVVPNGVNCREWQSLPSKIAARENLGLNASDLVVLFLGRLNPKKGLDILVWAFADAFPDRLDTKLVIAGGDGGSGYRQAIEKMAHDAGIESRVVMTGEVRGEAKRGALAAADMFVLPSHSEGIPVAVLEAMAAGIPVIISHGCNLPEVGEHGAGLVVEAEAQAVAFALAQVAGDESVRRRMGAQALTLAASVFDWSVVAKQMLGVYERIAKRTSNIEH